MEWEFRVFCFLLPFIFIVVVSAVLHDKYAVFYGDNGLHQTVSFPLTKNRERQAFKNEILQFLGLNKAPKRRDAAVGEKAAPSYMLDLYKSILSEEHDDDEENTSLNPIFSYLHSDSNGKAAGADDLFDANQADTIMSFINKLHHGDSSSSDHFEHLHFDLEDIKAEYRLIGAELRVFQNVSPSAVDDSHRTSSILQLFAGRSSLDGTQQNLHLIASSKLDASAAHASWLVLNVTTALEYWRNYPNENHGLLMEVLDERGQRHNPAEFDLTDAFMVAFFNAENHAAHRRVKRSRADQQVSYKDDYSDWKSLTGMDPKWAKTICQKRTLYVSFRDLGWQDWIIAPDGYAAYYCYGECSFPLTSSLNATNHAIVQTLANLMNPEFVPKPCCAPTKLSPISVLFFDDSSNVVLKKYNQMIVKSCGCH